MITTTSIWNTMESAPLEKVVLIFDPTNPNGRPKVYAAIQQRMLACGDTWWSAEGAFMAAEPMLWTEIPVPEVKP